MKPKTLAFYCFIILSFIIFNKDILAAASSTDTDATSVNITYKSSFETLYDSSSEKIYILIENTSNNTMILKSISATTPQYINSEDLNKNYINYVIAPKNSVIIPINIKSNNTVKPGKDVLLYDIALDCKTKDKIISFNKIISVDLNMAITVSSDILTMVGVPSLIFIPGFIILVVFSSFLKPYIKSVDSLDAKNPLFWVISISIGLLVAYLYPVLSGVLGKPNHDLLKNYGLEDILTVWIASLIFALVISVPLFLFLKWRIDRKLYSEKDSPLTIINKIARYQDSIILPKVKTDLFGDESQLYLIPNNSGKILACSAIVLEIDRNKLKKQKSINKINGKLMEMINKNKDINKLANYLFFNRNNIIVKWKLEQVGRIIELDGKYEKIGERSVIEYK